MRKRNFKNVAAMLVLSLVVGTVGPVATSFAAEKEIGDVVKSASDIETDAKTTFPELDNSMGEKISIKTKTASQKDVFEDVTLPDDDGIVPFSDSGHSTADTALFLDSSYMGNVLADAASDSENWYFFQVEETCKISAVLEQPVSGGDYDIYLYKYNDDGSLSLISYSLYSGSTMENLSAAGENGFYFLRVVPQTVATEADAVYFFMVSLITEYDACEPDDMPAYAVEYSNSIDVNNTIDNMYDQDWSKLTVSTGGTHIVSMSNIPDDCTYNLYVFDSSLNFLAGMSCSENKVGTVNLDAGEYYIKVASATGYSTAQSYNLKLMKRKSSYSDMMFTKTGQIVELTTYALYINGKAADMKWSYHYTVNYTRNQDVIPNDNASFLNGYLKNGQYSGSQGVSSGDCIAVYMDNFVYTYFCRFPGSGADYDWIDQPFEDGEYILFYVDAKTGKAIDTEINYYHLSLNMKQSFTEFN
ncbi:MAG: hypothetical protein HFH68_04650 [Lachnospiraceae bacterium]|nr:hypothetical protein [Lachnospiraceae bacterium]